MTLIFKVCGANEWSAAQRTGSYIGSEHDLRDGFIHFSTASQLAATLAKHYSGRAGLLLIAVDAEALGDALKWEPARDGDLFPHLYRVLPVAAASWTRELQVGETGQHVLPEEARP